MTFRGGWCAPWLINIAICLTTSVSTSSATTIFSGDHVTVEVAGVERVGSGAENLWKLQLIAQGTAGATVGGFDGRIEGLFHQQTLDAMTTPTLDEPSTSGSVLTKLDSHFLVHTDQILSVAPPAEDLNLALSSLEAPDATGTIASEAIVAFGSSLHGTFARLGGSVQRWPIVQLVAREGSTIDLDFALGFGGSQPPAKQLVQTAFVLNPQLLRVCGDFDADTDVDASDLTTLVINWTGTMEPGLGGRTFAEGDCDGDGDVDAEDLTGLVLNWTSAQAAPQREAVQLAEIPEPSCLAWLAAVVGLAASLRSARQDRQRCAPLRAVRAGCQRLDRNKTIETS